MSACMVCSSTDLRPVLRIDSAPVLINQLSSTREEALAAPCGPIELVYCPSCGHLFNGSFEASLVQYGPDYENSLHHSGRFRAFATELVGSLVQRHSLEGKLAIEVGCGSGDFLRELCETAGCKGLGFDESYRGPEQPAEGLRFSRGSFFESEGEPTALLCNRHVLEHVDDPPGFLGGISRRLEAQGGAGLYIEVPSSLYTLRDLGIWDIIYEHPSYFSPDSLRHAACAAGLEVLEVEESFGAQFLSMHARAGSEPAERSAAPVDLELDGLVSSFSESYRQKTGEWKGRLTEAAAAGQRVAVWGAGSKGSTFLNVVDPDGAVSCIVDLNPLKEGKFVAGSGHEIVAPERLRTLRPELVVLMNPVYEAEVSAMLSDLSPGSTLLLA